MKNMQENEADASAQKKIQLEMVNLEWSQNNNT
jgi:hypothetical protein